MRRVLVVAYYFPPIAAAGSVRLAGLVRLLPEFGWEPVVLTARHTAHASDPGVEVPGERIVRARSLEPARWVGAGGGSGPVGPAAPASLGARAREAARAAAHRYVYYPDPQIGWWPGAVAAGRRLVRELDFDAVYSSSFPVTAHLVASLLAKGGGLPWVAEYRDPWSDALPADHPWRARAQRLEQKVADRAAEVVLPTRTWADHLGARWGREVSVVPNGFDEPAGPARSAEVDPVVTHLGSYYPGRQDLRAAWTALAGVAGSGREIRLRVIGELTDAWRAELRAAGIESLVEERGRVPRERVHVLLASSAVLLGSDFVGDDPISRGVVASKLYEYVTTDRPVVYLGNVDSEAARLLSPLPGTFVTPMDDPSRVRAAIEAALAAPPTAREVDRFSRRAAVAAAAVVLDRASAAA